MSGNIAVSDKNDGTILYRTLQESKHAGWITLTPFGTGFDKAAITDFGRLAIRDCRNVQAGHPGQERRRIRYS